MKYERALHIDLFALDNTTCRFPTKQQRGTHLFCGVPEADLVGGKPYCPHHHAKAFFPPKRYAHRRKNSVTDRATVLAFGL